MVTFLYLAELHYKIYHLLCIQTSLVSIGHRSISALVKTMQRGKRAYFNPKVEYREGTK